MFFCNYHLNLPNPAGNISGEEYNRRTTEQAVARTFAPRRTRMIEFRKDSVTRDRLANAVASGVKYPIEVDPLGGDQIQVCGDCAANTWRGSIDSWFTAVKGALVAHTLAAALNGDPEN